MEWKLEKRKSRGKREEPSSREGDNTFPFEKKQEHSARMKIRTHDSAKGPITRAVVVPQMPSSQLARAAEHHIDPSPAHREPSAPATWTPPMIFALTPRSCPPLSFCTLPYERPDPRSGVGLAILDAWDNWELPDPVMIRRLYW